MRIEYEITFGPDGKPHATHRVTDCPPDLAAGGDPPPGPDPLAPRPRPWPPRPDRAGGADPPPGPDGGGGGDPPPGPDGGGGADPPPGPDGGGGLSACCPTVIVMGPTVVTGRCSSGGFPLSSGGHIGNKIPDLTTLHLGDPSPEATAPGFGVLPLSLKPQEFSEWCWAAVAQGVHSEYDSAHPLEQCDVARIVTLATDACANKGAYNQPQSMVTTLNRLGHLTKAFEGGRADFPSIQAEIATGHALVARISWDADNDGYEQNAHFVAISGWKNPDKLVVLDPLYGYDGTQTIRPTEVSYEAFRDAYQDTGVWSWTYLTGGLA